MKQLNLLTIEKKLNIAYQATNVAAYDFDFELFFECHHPQGWHGNQSCTLRVGAINDYESMTKELGSFSLSPINDQTEHNRASELSEWYPLIEDLTPRSICVDAFPTAEEVEGLFGWPIFIKGSRQTSRHNPDLAIAHDAHEYQMIAKQYWNDPILNWQKIAIREFVRLDPVPGQVPKKVTPSREYRTFWWHGECVGCGRYWHQVRDYGQEGLETGLAIAEVAARRLSVPFLCIDIAKTVDGHWIIIECNDAQESGYMGVVPQVLWRNITDRCS